jgi:glycosyltransferase involved in cell wall biosynthesis
MELSVVIPVYNEEENVQILYNELDSVLRGLGKSYEIILVDDGSTDTTTNILKSINEKDKNVKIIRLRRNFGQTAALSAGFDFAGGEVIVTLDADLQNDPKDIPKLIDKLDEGYDVVSGWRFERKDPWSKRILSRIANYLRKKMSGEVLHDSGCTLKAYRSHCLKNIILYGEMHRFIPTILRWKGYKIEEIKVAHRPRRHGKTKYNYKRVFRGFFDLLSATFLIKFFTRPLHFFGIIGLSLFALGALTGFINIVYYFITVGKVGVGPVLLLAALMILSGLQFFMFGLLGELHVRTYFEPASQKSYVIEKVYGNEK